jgi:DNA-directed RNA polymerase subunit RPC12/RpoP
MRVDVEPIDRFLQLMRENRPCPECGSSRITVRREQRLEGGALMRLQCADCARVVELIEAAAYGVRTG